MSSVFDFNGAPGSGWSQPEPIREDAGKNIPDSMRRNTLPRWPRASEPELVRHYTLLSQRNFGIDTGFYPLGSCTMKHNPRINERIVQMPGIDRIHPLQPDSQVQGLLAIYYEMQDMLSICAGMDSVTLQPVAGAQGEFTAIRCIQEYHNSNGESNRNKVIVPDSAHGTNPASAAMCGYEIVEIPSGSDGRIDLQALRAAVDGDTAAMMITNPSSRTDGSTNPCCRVGLLHITTAPLEAAFPYLFSLSLSTAMKASWGTSTLPIAFMRFLPLACFLSSFFFLEISPP